MNNDYFAPPDQTLDMKRESFFRSPATRWVDFQPVHGQLVLSGDKLSFFCADPEDERDWSISLTSLHRAEYFRRLNFHKHALLLFRKDGEIEQFSVKDRQAWKDQIMRSIKTTF